MGNVVSWFVGGTPLHAPEGLRRRGEASVVRSGDHGFRDGGLDGLRLAEDKRLVDDAQGVRSAAAAAERRFRGTAPGETILAPSMSSVMSDFTVRRREEGELLEDVGRSPLEGDTGVATRSPVYKHLWQRAKKRDSGLSSLEIQVKLLEKRISKFSKVSEVKPGEDLLGPFTPLTNEEENAVNLALWNSDKLRSHKDEVLVLHESSNIEITRGVIQCLGQRSWLNDELTSGKNGYDFKAVRRWTTLRKLGYGLIECDKIFVPIHKGMHWCLAVIDVRNEKLHYLDSLGGMDEHALKILACYYVDEVKDKYNKTIGITSWKYEAVDNLPRQKNGWDCGMFMLKYADFISRGLSLCFQQENMVYFRKRTVKEILRLRAE
ncbi:hypothetical protein Taro_045744 [Colocasia esculenta]|uniref:Ubiquitin-like protease family profile domain-containing protein n=1 Tax=Colocasia esculenta TaxID=4460 RepID=A0A843X4N3_COLES|nr:hypothetical protein [Colocasia esculenta]